jgi:hypothetical protein
MAASLPVTKWVPEHHILRAGRLSSEVPTNNVSRRIITMKASKLALGTVALVLLSALGWASDKMKANFQIYQTVNVGSTQLAPGEYKMTWTESGSNAEVTFSRGKKVIVTVPAQITQARSGYASPALHTDSVSNTLTGVALPNISLSFTSGAAVPAKSGN